MLLQDNYHADFLTLDSSTILESEIELEKNRLLTIRKHLINHRQQSGNYLEAFTTILTKHIDPKLKAILVDEQWGEIDKEEFLRQRDSISLATDKHLANQANKNSKLKFTEIGASHAEYLRVCKPSSKIAVFSHTNAARYEQGDEYDISKTLKCS